MANEDVQADVEGNAEVYEPKNPQEELAISRGWQPKELFQGEEGSWVDAQTFNIKGELMDAISKKTKQIKEYEKKIEKFAKYMEQQEEAAYERARQALLEEKAEALSNNDAHTVVQKDEELRQLEREKEEIKEKPESDSASVFREAFNNWLPNNSWYTTDKMMKTKANVFGEEFIAANPDATPEEMYEYVDTEIRRAFPSKFQNQKRREPGDIAPASNTGNKGRKTSVKLNAEERKVAQTFVDKGLFKSVEEYAAKMSELG